MKNYKMRMARAVMMLLLMLMTTTAAGHEIDRARNYQGNLRVSGYMGSFDGTKPTIHFVVYKRRGNGTSYQDENYYYIGEWDVTCTDEARAYVGYRFEFIRELEEGVYDIHAMWGDYEIFSAVRLVRPIENFVTFHTDHGTAPAQIPIPEDITRTLPVLSYAGYTFLGWNTASDGSGTNLLSVTNQSYELYARWLPGSGTADDPWRITSLQDWNVFRGLCNSNVSAVSLNENTHVRLDTDLTVTETMNSSNEMFQGEFNGNGHTITINSGSSSSIGLFHTAKDCYIHDLKVQGTVVNSNYKTSYMGGLAGRIVTTNGYLGDNGNGQSLIENCVVSVSLVPNTTTAGCTVGGFVGRQENGNDGGITFSNCVFNGDMPSTGNCTAGFVGASSSNLQFQNCFFTPRQMVQAPTFTFSNNYASASGIYYSEPGQDGQGQQICFYLPSAGVYKILPSTFDCCYYSLQYVVGISGLNDSYAYTGSPISINYTVSQDNATLATDAYTAVFRNAAGEAVESVQDLGLYTLEVTIPEVGSYARSFYVTSPLAQTDGVYLINSQADWTRFADDVASGNTYSGATVRLGADITTEIMVGTEDHKFGGTFDGDHHTLTFNYMSYKTVYDATENYRAPFRYISGSTIRDLTVAGTTSSTGRQMGGLVAYASGNNSITGCAVCATLTSHLGGDASNGGFIAHVQDGSTSFSSCVFNGYLISGLSCRGNGGFVGWSGGALSFTDCLFSPVAVEMPSTECSTFARCNNVTFTNTYYTTALGEVQQGTTHACISAQDCIGEKKTMTDGTEVYVIHGTSIEGLAATYDYNGGEAVAININNCSVSNGGQTLSPSKYTFIIRNSADEVVEAPTVAGQYTLTATGNNDASYYGSLSQTFMVVTTLASDENGYYLVSDANDWATLDYEVKNSPSFTGIKVKLTDDLSVTTMIGDGSHPFSGIFDGNGHTLTVNLTGGGTVAPFPFVSNATFINLHVVGSVSSTATETWTGGLVGEALGNVKIIACRSSVTITGTGMSVAGGFVATGGWAENRSITMRDCLFDGTLSGQLDYAAGFVGEYHTIWSSSRLSLYRCLMNGIIDSSHGEITNLGTIYCHSIAFPRIDSYYTTIVCRHKIGSSLACNNYICKSSYTDYTGTILLQIMGSGWTLDGDNVVPAMAALSTMCITVAPEIEHGIVACQSTGVPGSSINITITPDEYYVVSTVSYNDGTDHTITPQNGVYSFTMPEADVIVSATFELNPNAVGYMAYNTEEKIFENRLHVSPTIVTASSTTLGTADNETWYMVNSDVTVESRMNVNGTVHLILADDATLTSVAGITVHSGNTLNIYGQAEGTGAIVATVVDAGGNYAAIGTEDNSGDPETHTLDPKVLGTINIHGGRITADGAAWSAGIGGGVGGGGGTINIYGGHISATATNPGYGIQQAIGCGSSGDAVTRTIINGMRVYCNNNSTPTSYNNRIDGIGQHVAVMEPCTEHNYVNNVCAYCGLMHHYTFAYDGNGATSGIIPEPQEYLIGGNRTVFVIGADNFGLERTGYTFTGWNTEADGSGTTYETNTTFVISEMITLYAQWTPDEYTIAYDLNGGTLPEGESNPVTYTIESEAITLVNPTKEGCYFMGWTGTGINGSSTSVTIPASSIGHRSYIATWDNNEPPFAGMEIDHDYNNNPDQLGRYFVKMPYPGEEEYDYDNDIYYIVGAEETPRIVNIPEGFVTPFKVYDDGGKYDRYSQNPSESHITTLILNAPEGTVLSVRGDIDIATIYGDWLKIYDGTTTDNEIDVKHTIDEWDYEEVTIIPFVTTGKSIRFDLYAEDDMCSNGLDLTVEVITAPTNIILANGYSISEQTNSSLIASNNGAFANVTIDGRTLYRDGTWNTLCLPFDIDDISKTPLKDATVKELGSTAFEDGTLTLSFSDDLTALEAGKPYIVKWASRAYFSIIDPDDNTVTALNFIGEVPEVDNGQETSWGDNGSENYDKLVDGKTSTKYGIEDESPYVEFHYTSAITPKGYALWTANDEEGARNPSSWIIKAKNEGDEDWKELVTVDNSDGDKLPMANKTCTIFPLDNSKAYKYFRFEATLASNKQFQLAELQFCTVQPDESMINIVNPTFHQVTIKNEQHPMTSNGVTFAGNYGVLSTLGLMLDEHNLYGDALHATLSITDPTTPTGYTFEGWYTDDGLITPATTIPFNATTGNVTLHANITENLLEMANNADNSDAISDAATNGGEFKATLADRTLWKDGDWNTLCLPFSLSAAQIAASCLADAEIRTLSSASMNETGTLTLNFTPATGEGAVTELVAGTPYIIKWTRANDYVDDDEHNLVNPVFTGVTVDATMHNQVCDLGDGKSISFTGNYSPVVYTAGTAHKDVLFLGSSSTLYYPDGAKTTTINSCRAYFLLNGITAGDPNDPYSVKAFNLNLGEGVATEIRPTPDPSLNGGEWYDLSGRKLAGKPTKSGVYMNNGRKVAIK